jgi:hypothetical protein
MKHCVDKQQDSGIRMGYRPNYSQKELDTSLELKMKKKKKN